MHVPTRYRSDVFYCEIQKNGKSVWSHKTELKFSALCYHINVRSGDYHRTISNGNLGLRLCRRKPTTGNHNLVFNFTTFLSFISFSFRHPRWRIFFRRHNIIFVFFFLSVYSIVQYRMSWYATRCTIFHRNVCQLHCNFKLTFRI